MDELIHRRNTKTLNLNDAILFADDESNMGYGKYVWELQTELPDIPLELIQYASDYYKISIDDAEDLINPSDIVDSAGAWDDRQFVSDLWQEMESGLMTMVPGYRTMNGAVVIDRDNVKLRNYVEDE